MTRELALRLLVGQRLTRCAGSGWFVGENLVPVDSAVFTVLRTSFRLLPGGDALPGFVASMSQTLLLELLRSDDALGLLLPAIHAADGVSA
jgi:hypothetical protein